MNRPRNNATAEDEAEIKADGGQAWERWFQPGRFLMLLGLVVFIGYFDVIVGGNTFITRDFAYFGYPLAHYHKLSFWNGEIPLWNPLNNCGLPFLAQWNTLVLYPGSLLYLLLPLSWALGIFCLLHLMLGGLGMYFLAWRWTRNRLGACVAGMAFATNGLALNSIMWPNNVSALGWMPWVVLLAEQSWTSSRRRFGLAVLIGAMQMLTGAPEIILLTWLFIGLLGVGRMVAEHPNRWKIARRLFASTMLIAGLATAQLLPFFDLLLHSQRDERFYESVWPMPGSGWANLLVPLFHCVRSPQGFYFQPGQYWTSSYYVGVGVLTLAILAALVCRSRRVWFLTTISVLGVALAMGDGGYLYRVLKNLLPAIGFIRFPIKFVVWVIFCVPLLAAYGARSVFSTEQFRSSSLTRLEMAVVVGVTGLMGILVLFARANPVPDEQWTDTGLSGFSRACFLWGWIALALMLRKPRTDGGRILIGAVIVLLAGADPMTYAHQKTPTAPRAAFDARILSLNPRPEFGNSRVVTTYWAHQNFNKVSTSNPLNDFLTKRSGLFADCNLLEGIPKLDGFFSLYLHEPDAIWSLFYFQTNNSWIPRTFSTTNQLHYAGLLDFIGASYLSSPKQYFDWTPRTGYLPVVTGGQSPVFTNQTGTLRGLVDADFDPRRTVFLPTEARDQFALSKAEPPQLSAAYDPHKIVVGVTASETTAIVIAQSYYHPWHAYQDDRPRTIWKANFAFQAIAVPPGNHVIQFVYEDWLFVAGVMISWLSFAWLSIRMIQSARIPTPQD